jgi:hypothetical protein
MTGSAGAGAAGGAGAASVLAGLGAAGGSAVCANDVFARDTIKRDNNEQRERVGDMVADSLSGPVRNTDPTKDVCDIDVTCAFHPENASERREPFTADHERVTIDRAR